MAHIKQFLGKCICTIFVISLTASLTACTSAEKMLEEKILEESGILDTKEYKAYKQMTEDGSLTEDGRYDAPTINVESNEELNQREGIVHVTFATNRYLQVDYYLDMALKNKIDQENCYINPGDSIYAKIVSTNPNTNLYEIAEFRVIDYSSDTQKEILRNLEIDGLVYQLPANFVGTEIGVIPVGKYKERKISLQVSMLEDDGKETTLSNAGTLYVNNEKYQGNTATINPLSPYILKYEFDKRNYFFVRSDPDCFTEDPNTEGVIEFFEADPTQTNIDYFIQLHKYISLDIKLDDKGIIWVNDGEPEEIKKGRTWQGRNLMFGDVLVIESAGVCTFEGNANIFQVEKDPILNGFRYTISIVNSDSKNNEDYITLFLDTNGRYGICSFKLDGKEVSGPTTVQKNQKLKLSYAITEDGYEFKNSNLFSHIQGFIGNMTKTIEIPLSKDLDNSTIHPDEWIEIVKK